MNFTLSTEDVPDSFSRYKDSPSDSQYIWQTYKNHTNVSMFTTYYANIYGEMAHSVYTASIVNYAGHFKSKASSFIPSLDTVTVCLSHLIQGMVLDQTLVSFQRIHMYLYTYFFQNNV